MIMQLRHDWMAAHPGPDALKNFNDRLLGYGGPPIPLVRAQMLGGKAEAKLWTVSEESSTPSAARTQ